MKKLAIILIILNVFAYTQGAYAQFKKYKDNVKHQNTVDKFVKKEIFAVVVTTEGNALQPSNGQTALHAIGMARIREHQKTYVTQTTNRNAEQLGIGKNSKSYDKLENVITTIVAGHVKGTMFRDYGQLKQNRIQKKEGVITFICIAYVSPKSIYKSLENEIEGMDEDEELLQRYRSHELKKKHDEQIKQYKEEFDIE